MMISLQIRNSIIGLLVLFGPILCHPAQDLCQTIYRESASEVGTFFISNHCQVQCNFTGRLTRQNINDGRPCPPGMNLDRYVCESGRCQQRALANIPLGRLRIPWVKAQLVTRKEPDTYLLICVLNNSPDSVTLPLEGWKWFERCHSCSSDVIRANRSPNWVQPCPLSERYPVYQNSRIIFEIWTYDGVKSDKFLGGAQLRLDELINVDRQPIPLSSGTITGALSTEIKWD